ncbi:unnamed protein product [Notodromas monacha]|uniref:Uncharacterized protein n=1 Tax=Notodromas monacha TaxID=399045 RepID=A0A7R9BBP8_9CRUS|nr:unnamed protein product [Notodromas monacha]CAG0912249.1 unnamed protein product [Notodromas monacha]
MEWQMGTTKVFMRSRIHEPLEEKRKNLIESSSIQIQKIWKGTRVRQEFLRKRRAVAKIQATYRSMKQRLLFNRMRRAAITIQSGVRGMFAREVAGALREMRRVEEEQVRREKLEEERKQRENKPKPERQESATDADETLSECSDDSYLSLTGQTERPQEELDAVNNITTQLNRANIVTAASSSQAVKPGVEKSSVATEAPAHPEVDLDNLFDFLAKMQDNNAKKKQLDVLSELDDIGREVSSLASGIQQRLDIHENKMKEEAKPNSRPRSMHLPPPDFPPPPPPPPASTDSRGDADEESTYAESLPTTDSMSTTTSASTEMPAPPSPPPLPQPNMDEHMDAAAQADDKDISPPEEFRNKELNEDPRRRSFQEGKKLTSGRENHYASVAVQPRPGAPQPSANPNQIRSPSPGKVEDMRARSRSPYSRQQQQQMMRNGSTVSVASSVGGQSTHSWKFTPGGDLPVPPGAALPPGMLQTMPEESDRELKRRLRIERRIQELGEKEESRNTVVEPETDEHYDIIEFAEKYFNNHEKYPDGTIVATLTRRKGTTTNVDYIPKYEMVTYTKGYSIPTSHIQMFDPDNITTACNTFRDICRYMRGELKGESEIDAVQSIVGCSIEREELRDEVMIQLMRQITNNPSPEWTEKLWLLLALCVAAFHPSKTLAKYFMSFLKKNLQTEGKIRQYVRWCIENSRSTKAYSRKMAPSSVEIAAMRRLGTVVCRFFFMDGRTKAIDLHPCDTAHDAMRKLADKLGLHSLDGWAIYQQSEGGETHVKAHDYLYDVIAMWELKNNPAPAPSTIPTLTKRPKPVGLVDNRFIFRKRLFRKTREISQDPVEISLLFSQAVYAVVKSDDFPVSEKVALQLAGLQAQAHMGDPRPDQGDHPYSDPSAFLPERILKTRPPVQWIQAIVQAHHLYGAGKSDLIAKVWYLSSVMQYPLWGSVLFLVSYKGYWPYGNEILLGVNCDGLSLIRPEDKFVISEYRYEDIESLFLDPSDNFITLNLSRAGSDGSLKSFVFETKDKVEIGSLISSYYPPLSSWARDSDLPIRRVKLTPEDRARLYYNVIAARRGLAESETLKRPTDELSFFRNTFRRLSKAKGDKYKHQEEYAGGDWLKSFPHGFWAFSRYPLTQSLIQLESVEQEEVAIQMSSLILAYAGIAKNSAPESNFATGGEGDPALIAQSILEKAMSNPRLMDELYCQLIKQTTDGPDPPGGKVAIRIWALFALACSVALPSLKLLRRLLNAHLKKTAADYVSEEGNFARYAEKCMHRTAESRQRQWAPSRQEILCTLSRRPIYARFYLMGGNFHTIEFDPSVTAEQILDTVREKVGLKETATGFALYEVYGIQERSLQREEKLSDILSKWEKFKASASGKKSEADPYLLFKKHLFLEVDLHDLVEQELLYHQTLHMLRTDRHPLTLMEAVMLCALAAQVEWGDWKVNQDYDRLVAQVLPTRIMKQAAIDSNTGGSVPEQVNMHHQSLQGMSAAQAKEAFLTLIQSWSLYRATIFNVTVSNVLSVSQPGDGSEKQWFTSNWPRELWLAVDPSGVHLLEPHARSTLCTYSYDYIVNYSPSMNSLMIITGSLRKQSKIILNTNMAFQIATLIRDYSEALRPAPVYLANNGDHQPRGSRVQFNLPTTSNGAVSILHKPVPHIGDNELNVEPSS